MMNAILDVVELGFRYLPQVLAAGALFTFGMYMRGMYPSIRKRNPR